MSTHIPLDDDEVALDPAAMLALSERQKKDVQARIASLVPWILLAWGIAWGVGFLVLWFIDGVPGFGIPLPVAIVTFIGLMVAALAVSAILGPRMGTGIKSTKEQAFVGTAFGLMWPVGFFFIYAFGTALMVNGMAPDLMNIYYPVVSTAFVGFMYLVAGILWKAVPAMVMGGWIILLSAVAPFFGYPTHYLIFAIGGGGVFLVGAIAAFFFTGARRVMGRA